METLTNPYSAVVVPLVLVITQIIKKQNLFPRERMSLVAIGFGLLITLVVELGFKTSNNMFMVALLGFLNGAAAVGLYEAGDSTGVNDKIGDTLVKIKG